jgi:5-formyltetrahydrofolate cyclo-ligase
LLGKDAIRKEVWRLMDESNVSKFPMPIVGRIPNFEGSEIAAKRLVSQSEFKNAKVVKVNPDFPQVHVRRAALFDNKLLLMPTPRLRMGFMILDPEHIPGRFLWEASTIKGAFKHGRLCSIEKLPSVDLIVAGSVAVTQEGVRIGKGGGYSEIEYGILKELGKVNDSTPVFTTVHDVQIIDQAPRDQHDFLVDAIFTPTKIIRIKREIPQPRGIFWEKLTEHQLINMPILQELKNVLNQKRLEMNTSTMKKLQGSQW